MTAVSLSFCHLHLASVNSAQSSDPFCFTFGWSLLKINQEHNIRKKKFSRPNPALNKQDPASCVTSSIHHDQPHWSVKASTKTTEVVLGLSPIVLLFTWPMAVFTRGCRLGGAGVYSWSNEPLVSGHFHKEASDALKHTHTHTLTT